MNAVVRPFVRSPYNNDRNEVSRETALAYDPETDPSMTKQSFKDECDINVLVKRFGVTGVMMQNVRPPTYGDFTNVGDFQSAMNAIAEARESFDAMPADVRRRFENDPQRFVAFCSDAKNLEEMRKMGLAIPAVVVDDAPAAIVPSGGNSDVKPASVPSGEAKGGAASGGST